MKKKDKYLLTIEGKLKLLPISYLENLAPNEAFLLGLNCISKQRQQMIHDAVEGTQKYYGHEIVGALEESISKLEERFPELRSQFRQLTRSSQQPS